MTQNKIKVVILGASGYAGGDLIRMLSSHKNVDIVALSANAKSGISPSKTHSSLFNTNLPEFIKTEENFKTDTQSYQFVAVQSAPDMPK